jgi:hypothetical protein
LMDISRHRWPSIKAVDLFLLCREALHAVTPELLTPEF